MPKRRSRRAAANALQIAQLGIAAPQVIAHRVARMALAGTSPSLRDRREFTGMIVEKQVAFAQAWAGVAIAAARLQQQWFLSLLTGRAPSLHGSVDAIAAKAIAPFRRKAVSNSKRLGRTRLR